MSPTFGGYGGLESFVMTITAGLASSPDLEVRLVFKRATGFALSTDLQAEIARQNVHVEYVDRASFSLARTVWWADLVHAQNPSPDVVVLTRLLRRRLLISVINHRLSDRSLHSMIWRWSLRRADRRFYISDFVRRTWEGKQPWIASEVVFPICALAEGALPPAQRRGFVFVGRWIENKGLDTLVEAYASAALAPERWPLTLVGDGPLRPAIERRVAKLGLRGVIMPGFVAADVKAAAIRSARWMVVPPNTNEDFGLTALEARHLGVPCIITRDGGVPEAAGEEAIACQPGNTRELAAALLAAAAMPENEYAARAERTKATLGCRLAGPEYYAKTYREMLRRR